MKEIPEKIFSVEDKNIILTGSSGLLGSVYAKALIERGANMALIDIHPQISKKIKNEYKNTQNIRVYKCDLSKPSEITSTFKQISKDFSSYDVLINNAVFSSRQTFHIKDFKNYETHPFSLWRDAFKVNIDAVHLCTQKVIGKMKTQKNGVIINISSTYGVVGPDFATYDGENLFTPPGYAVTKSAVLNFTRYIANLYGKYNIRCNTFTPSGVATDSLSKNFIKKYSSRNALNRMAKTSDYIGPIVFLCSDASKYMTGSNLIVDAGWTAR